MKLERQLHYFSSDMKRASNLHAGTLFLIESGVHTKLLDQLNSLMHEQWCLPLLDQLESTLKGCTGD